MAVAIKTQPDEKLTLARIAAHYRIDIDSVRKAVVKRKVPIKDGRIPASRQSDVYFGALAERRVRMYAPRAMSGEAINIGDTIRVEKSDELLDGEYVVVDVDNDEGRPYVEVFADDEPYRLSIAPSRFDGPNICRDAAEVVS